MSKITNDSKKEQFIKYYKNQLIELNEGCWILNKTGRSCGYHTVYKLENVFLPDKIYNKFCQVPIYSPIIEDIKYMIDNCEVELFSNNVLYKKDNKTPRKYSVLLKFEGKGFNNRFHICYDYEFSKLKYPHQKLQNDFYYSIERKKDIEYKLYILQNLPLAKL
tara:strand:- start:206 stop:694 length:489 start_codon:yes stop_codon:yes gene_type:complete